MCISNAHIETSALLQRAYPELAAFIFYSPDAQISKKFFREDYTYFESTQSFYKIHTLIKTWRSAKRLCAKEEATLLYPEDEKEAIVVSEYLNKTQPFSWVYVGGSARFANGVFETIDGVSVIKKYHRWGPGEPVGTDYMDCMVLTREGTLHGKKCSDNYPFICKKSLASLEWNTLCNMPNQDYEYNEAVGRCYKFHPNPLSWSDAYATCAAEQSYLAIIDSDVEANVLVNLTARGPANQVVGSHFRGLVHLGFHNLDDEGWSTTKGVFLTKSGYSHWSRNHPNNSNRNKCGSMNYNGQLNDIGCEYQCFFICEHEIDLISNAANDLNVNDDKVRLSAINNTSPSAINETTGHRAIDGENRPNAIETTAVSSAVDNTTRFSVIDEKIRPNATDKTAGYSAFVQTTTHILIDDTTGDTAEETVSKNV